MRFFLISPFDFESIGVRSIAAALHRAGIEVHLHYFQPLHFNAVVLPEEDAYQVLLAAISKFCPDMVGISVRSPFLQCAVKISRLVRESLGIPVIWGGAHATVLWRECLREADYVCLGEGEISLVELLCNPPAEINGFRLPLGIAGRHSSTHDSKPQWIENLDGLADPLFNPEFASYQDGTLVRCGDPLLLEEAFLQYGEVGFHEVLGSRGCPYTCSYCCAPLLSSQVIRTRAPERVVAEIRAMQSLKRVVKISFLDQLFGSNMAWLREFAEIYPKQVGLSFSAEMHPEICTPERIELAAKAGLSGVELGIQSGSERIRNEIYNRPVSRRQIIDAVRLLAAYGIAVTVDVILDNPYETERDLQETFELLLELPRPLGVKIFSLCHFPGTVLTARLLKDGLIGSHDLEHHASKSHGEWRAHLYQKREPWRFYWTSLIMLAGLRTQSAAGQSWLSIPSREKPATNLFSAADLLELASNPGLREQPERLRDIYFAHVSH